MAERAQDLPVVSQQGPNPGKDHQVGGPSGQSDSGYYPDSLDQTSPACGQTSKEQTENGATGGAELCDTGGVKEKQGSELSGSGGQDVPTEQPREGEDNTRSFPVIGPRILVNEHVASCAVKTPATHNGEVAGEADTKKPQQDSQPPLSCSSTSRAVPDSDTPSAEADLTSLNSIRIAILSTLHGLGKTACQGINDLVHHPAEVNPTALHKMLLDIRLQISEASENLLMATGTAHTPETPATNTSDVRKGAPRSKNPTEAHTNLPVSSSSHQNLLVGEDSKTENPVKRGTAPNGTEDPVQVGTAPNSTGDSVQVVTAPKGTDDSESEQVVTAPNSREDTVQVVTAPKDTEVSVQVGTASNSTEKQVQMGTAPNSTEDSVQMVTAHSSTENPIQMVTAPNSTEDSESVQVVTTPNNTEDPVQVGTTPNSTEDLMQVLIALKGTDDSESEQVVTAPKDAEVSVQVGTASNSTEDSVQVGTAPNSTEDSVQVGTAPNSTEDSEPMGTVPNSTEDSVHMVTAPKSTEEPANNRVLHDNPVNEGHLEDQGKAEVLSNSPMMKSHSKPANKDHCHVAEQKKGRKKESGGIKKKDHGKKVTPTPKQLPPDQAVEEDQVDITTIKKVLRQNSLPEGQDDATAEKETFIKAKFEEEDMHKEKGRQLVCLKKPELIITSKKRDEKKKRSTNRKQGFLVQIRGCSSSSHGHQETPPNTKTPKKASIQTWTGQRKSFLIALLVQLYTFFTSWIHKEKPPDVKSCKTDTAGIVLEHDVQVYHMQADEDQDTCTPPDPSEHGDHDQQTDDHNTPEWLIQEDVEDDDLYLGTDNPTDDSAPSTTVTADPCTEGPEGGQIVIGAVGHSVGSTGQELLLAGGHSSHHLHTALRQDSQALLPFTCALETELQHYRETERGISVTVLDFGGQVLNETRIFAPTAVQQHMIEHIAAMAFSAFPMLGFTVRWPGGRPIPLGTSLDPLTAQNIILQMYHADEGDSSWQWRIVEEEVTGRSTYMYAVEANIHQQVSGGGEQREQGWDTSTHGSRGDEEEKVRDDGDKGDLCAICFDGDSLVKTTCKHCFHQMCLQRWLQYQNTCPVCRKENPQILERES